MDELTNRIETLWRRGHQVVTPDHPALAVMVGLDRPAPDYDWDGERRRVDPRGRELVVQISLAGAGEFIDAAGSVHPVPAGSFFTAVVPSRHRYRRPSGGPPWRIWWVQILHPEAVARGEAAIAEGGHVHPLPPGGELAAALVTLTAMVRGGRYRDALALERDALTAAIELQRLVRHGATPTDERWALESAVRERVMADLARPPDLAELAAVAGTSPSAFGHRFRRLVGTSPARFVTRVRLEAVRRLLETGDEPLVAIAARCGFADANHLCKVFRRHLGTSPGAWRERCSGSSA